MSWLPDWVRYGPRWNLLEKTNSHATRDSVRRWAIIGAVGGAVVDAYICYRLGHWLPILGLPVAVVAGALLGVLVEWQIDDHE